MSKIFMNTSLESQKYIDGELIDDKSLIAEYDGDILNLDIKDNDDETFTTLNNEELLGLFSAPNNNKTIDERLNDSFPTIKQIKPSKSSKSSKSSKPTRRKKENEKQKQKQKKAKKSTRKNNSSKNKNKKKK